MIIISIRKLVQKISVREKLLTKDMEILNRYLMVNNVNNEALKL